MDNQLIVVILGAASVLGVLVYLVLEQKARVLRTRIIDRPGTLRFEAHTFYVEVQQSAKQLKIHANAGQWSRTPLQGGTPQGQDGVLDVFLPAPGLHINVSSAADQSSAYTISLQASDELGHAASGQSGGFSYTVKIEGVPKPVAASFHGFANRVRLWVEKVEHRLKADQLDMEKAKEAAAKAEAQAKQAADAANRKDSATGSYDKNALAPEQIAFWRKAAGFKGSASELSTDDKGQVAWFIDLTDDGRVTIHANKRTVHTSLLGAKFTTIGGELEISVRDEYWSEDDPTLVAFRLFQGLPPNDRHTWRERLEAARDKLDKKARIDAARGYKHEG